MSHPLDPGSSAGPDPAGSRAGSAGPGGRGPLAGRLTRRRLAVLAGALVALLLILWALAQRDDDPAPTAEPTTSASSPPESSPGPEPTESATPPAVPGTEPEPEPAPGTEPTSAPADPAQPALPAPLAPRTLTEEAEIGPEAVARVSLLESVEGEPQGVGEIAGPALRFTIQVENTGTEPIPVQDAVINVTYGSEATPATEVSGPGRQPFAGQIAPGGSASGTYVFVVPAEERGTVSVSLEYRAGAPVAVFQGSAAAAPPG